MTDKLKTQDLVMVDFADRDPRSFKAYLRGAADGRQRLYEKLLAANTCNDLEALHDKFAVDVWDEDQAKYAVKDPARAVAAGKVSFNFVVPVVGLLLGVMLYQVFVA